MENDDNTPKPAAELIADLQARNWSYAQIGTVIGLTRGAVCDIRKRRTVQPHKQAAQLLRRLHESGISAPTNPHDHWRTWRPRETGQT